jgi:two-component system, chemotaxis family, chemotaxis protein CheY
MPFDLMLVDDSPVMRHFILRVLNMSGFDLGRCLQASDGLDAITQLDRLASEEHRVVNAVLTDINMPRMDGEELVKHIRERSFMEGVPVVVISTDATHTRINRLMAIGAQGYVTKPFSPERLRQELERVLPAAARKEFHDGEFDGNNMGGNDADSDF